MSLYLLYLTARIALFLRQGTSLVGHSSHHQVVTRQGPPEVPPLPCQTTKDATIMLMLFLGGVKHMCLET